jgi:hypothetical protein
MLIGYDDMNRLFFSRILFSAFLLMIGGNICYNVWLDRGLTCTRFLRGLEVFSYVAYGTAIGAGIGLLFNRGKLGLIAGLLIQLAVLFILTIILQKEL